MPGQQAEIVVASVFYGHGQNEFWLRMQIDNLRKSIGSFDHVVYLNDADESIFTESLIIGSSKSPRKGSQGHLDGLNEIKAFCQSRKYKYYLILDSDCFTISENWVQILSDSMTKWAKQYAAPARVENLDVFPHPCALFTSNPAYIDFAFVRSSNLLGREMTDIMCMGSRDMWFPMLKTNRVSRHPVLASIYSDLFYHHGSGSRELWMRSIAAGYYDQILHRYGDPATLIDELKSDPNEFISAIR